MESLEMRQAAQTFSYGTRPEFWTRQRVLLTGHTGFKGAWMAFWLTQMGAEVIGFALPPGDPKALYTAADLSSLFPSELGDLCDCAQISAVVARYQPQIVVHLAAQALVQRGVADPLGTFTTNVIGNA
jgi:CDP-glucose 4,6-dehydratase